MIAKTSHPTNYKMIQKLSPKTGRKEALTVTSHTKHAFGKTTYTWKSTRLNQKKADKTRKNSILLIFPILKIVAYSERQRMH